MSVHADERRVVTVLFGDLVGFTAMAETLDPEAVKALVDRGFERLVRDIVEFGGRVDKILGDAIVALFGAPIAHEDDAERAVRAALTMQKTMRDYAAEVGADIQMRIGVNTGEVLTGAMRAGGDYTAMGDVVNTASRLQTQARPGEVYVGSLTHEATRDVIAYEEVGLIQARGREEPIGAWRARDVLVLPGRRPRHRQSALVGRDPEVALVRSAAALAFSQQRTLLVLLLGEAGVGKTRLADEVASWMQRERGALMLESHCVPYGEANIWYPIGAALQALCDIPEGASPPDARNACEKLLARTLGAEPDSDTVQATTASLLHLMGYDSPLRALEPQRARDESSRALIRLLEALAAEQPVFFRLADLHWADDLVLELIDEVVDGLGRSPVVLVASARHLLDARWKPRVGRHNHLVINLDPLDTVAASQLLDHLLDGEVDAQTRRMLLTRSGGNPFFLEELVALLERQEAHEGFGAEPVPIGHERELPETLRGLIAARLDRLSQTERAVLDNAAVLGRSGPLFALEKMSGTFGMAATWRAGLDALVDKELLNLAGNRWSFRSDLVREVAYGMLTKGDRARRHADIAVWMEANVAGAELDDGVVDRVAYHYALAAALANELGFAANLPTDLTGRALHWLGEAARRAKAADVHVLAARLFSQALDLAGTQPSPQRLEFLLGRAEARFGLIELVGARADVDEAIAVADALGDERGRSRAWLALGEIKRRGGDPEGALATLEDALAASRAIEDRRGEAEALRLLGMTRLAQRHYSEAERSISEALDTFRELADRRGEAWALQSLAWIAYLAGRVGEAEVRIGQSAAAFSEIGDAGGMGWANALLAFTRFRQGRVTEAEKLAEEVLPAARARGDRIGEGLMLLLTGLIRLWSGRTAAAVERADEAHALYARVGDVFGQVQAQTASARAAVAAGQVVAGFETLDAALSLARRAHDANGEALAATVCLATALHIGDLGRASAVVDLVRQTSEADPISASDRASALVLYELQSGRAAEGLAHASEFVARAGADVSPGLVTLVALGCLVAGDLSGALENADRAHSSPRATYLDLALTYAVAGLANALRGDASEVIASFAAGRQVVDATGDAVAQAIVRLAEAHALAAVGATSARSVRREAERLLANLGIDAEGWQRVFSAVDVASAPSGSAEVPGSPARVR